MSILKNIMSITIVLTLNYSVAYAEDSTKFKSCKLVIAEWTNYGEYYISKQHGIARSAVKDLGLGGMRAPKGCKLRERMHKNKGQIRPYCNGKPITEKWCSSEGVSYVISL